MSEVSKEAILETVLKILNQLADDWEYSGEITPKTFFIADLGLESIDVVILGTTIQKHYDRSLPFAEFLAEIGQREVRDIRIDEFVDFVYQNLYSSQSA
jgi:acyl carrier protein